MLYRAVDFFSAGFKNKVFFTRIKYMPKQKTHKGLSKRIKVTASGKIKHKRSGGGHLMSGKNAKRRRKIGKAVAMEDTMAKKARIELCK
jgi:large subunit ribosomal protein L35